MFGWVRTLSGSRRQGSAGADLGLPKEWQAELPRANGVGDGKRTMAVSGVSLRADTGEIDLGHLAPSAEPLELPPEVAGIVHDAKTGLNLAVINAEYNPFRDSPRDRDGKPLVGPFTDSSRLFTAKIMVPMKSVVEKAVEAKGLSANTALKHLVTLLDDDAMFETPAHQFNVPGGIGNRVVFYGGAIGHGHIDRLTQAFGARHMRLIKQMVHLNKGCSENDKGTQGGDPTSIGKDGVGGSTHVGGFSAGFDAKGEPISIKSDWPASYGHLSDGNKDYNAHILAIDYARGTRDPIPEAALAAYKRNADMWDCCAGMLVDFASSDLDPAFTNYTYNPLEVYDQRSARAVAAALARMDPQAFLIEHGAFYCAEGQYCVANLGPQEDAEGGTLLKQNRYGATSFGRLIANFAEAPGYQGLSLEERRKRPHIGWQHLKALGAENGGISNDHFVRLGDTDRLGTYLEFIPEDVKGWQAYRPTNADGLIARPMTIATMSWALLRRYLPKDAIAKALAEALTRVYTRGAPAAVRKVLHTLAGGQELAKRRGQMAISVLAGRIASEILVRMLDSKEMRDTILKQGGFNEIPSQEDKDKVLAIYKEFIDVVRKSASTSQAEFDAALRETDRRSAGLMVTRMQTDKAALAIQPGQTPTPMVARSGTLMKYAAPACYVAWAQQPFLAETGCIRYVATAMHVSQAAQQGT
jgi:hypothetical protein